MNSTRFVSFFCDHVIPKINDIPDSTEEGGDSKLELLKLLAELSLDCGTLEKPDENVDTIYNCLIVRLSIHSFFWLLFLCLF